MAQKNINPFELLGTQVASGLASVDASLTGGISENFDSLNNYVYNYVQPLFYIAATQFDQNELKSVGPAAVNAYINADIGDYSK
jgi:hypothetical protein